VKIKKITFVIPTKNRTNYLKRLIVRGEKIFKKLNYEYFIVDASNNYFHTKNLKIVKKFKKAKIIRQKSKGIQIGCFESIPSIKTKYVVFLYDDDQLSNFIFKIYKSNIEEEKTFSFGYGVVKDIKSKIFFKNLNENLINKNDALLGYFGEDINKNEVFKKSAEKILLPLSPICTTYTLSFLKKWKKTVQSFVYKNSFRNFFLLKKEVGPDLLIYLMSIYNSKKIVKLYTPCSAKFSSHENSISIIYGSNFLRIGYWLSKICFFYVIKSQKNNLSNKIYTYLITFGLFLLLRNIFNFFYFKNILIEIIKLNKASKNKFLFFYSIKLLFNRIIR
tara:strand:+ start:14603 stop:15601 length:999 start_codon:yes stop_codon:yes gene_type:complete